MPANLFAHGGLWRTEICFPPLLWMDYWEQRNIEYPEGGQMVKLALRCDDLRDVAMYHREGKARIPVIRSPRITIEGQLWS